jgi:AcrR family transcriptional regulator
MQGVGDDELGRRERKKMETRAALARAAIGLALERGPDNVTVEEIADAADVSVRTFFNYFAAKEEAMVGQDPALIAVLHDALLARPASEPPLEALRQVLAPPGADLVKVADSMTRRARLVAEHQMLLPRYLAGLTEMERSLETAMRERLGSDDQELYPAIVVSVAVQTLRRSLSRWAAGDRDRDLSRWIEEAFAILASGLEPVTTTA